jgi:hypothetical protein
MENKDKSKKVHFLDRREAYDAEDTSLTYLFLIVSILDITTNVFTPCDIMSRFVIAHRTIKSAAVI